jgi:hypothetical protein
MIPTLLIVCIPLYITIAICKLASKPMPGFPLHGWHVKKVNGYAVTTSGHSQQRINSRRKPSAARSIWARNGIDFSFDTESARRACLVGRVKQSRQNETITSWNLTSAIAKLLLRLKTRNPFATGCSLKRVERRSEQNAASAVRYLLIGGGRNSLPLVQACKSESVVNVKHPGSIPGASTTLFNLNPKLFL